MERRYTIHSLMAFLLTAVLLTACQQDNMPEPIPGDGTGCIVLRLSEPEVFVQTRAEGTSFPDLSQLTFTLNGTATDGTSITNHSVAFTDNTAIIPAGIYTLTATSKTDKDAAPWYQGTSPEFALGIGATQSVSIDLGAPKNAKISVIFSSDFTSQYEDYSVTIGTKSVTSSGDLFAASGEITYTVKAKAMANSHVSDLPTNGVSAQMTVEAGKAYTLNINASKIDEIMLPFGGEHNGVFDARPQIHK